MNKDSFMLTPSEIERYARHIVLKQIGGAGQAKLKAAKVLIIGAGGLGAPLSLYLAAAGVGYIGLIDDDRVSLSNLQRQILFGDADLERLKVEAGAEALKRLNPHINISLYPYRLDRENAARLIENYDVIADGSDNFETRYLVSDACFYAKKPLVTASVNEFDGALTTLRPFEKNAEGQWNPSYRCLFPHAPPAGMVPTCSEVGVIGALTGVMGSLQALEVIREIAPFGEGLLGKLLLVDGLYMRFSSMEYAWDEHNPLSGKSAL